MKNGKNERPCQTINNIFNNILFDLGKNPNKFFL